MGRKTPRELAIYCIGLDAKRDIIPSRPHVHVFDSLPQTFSAIGQDLFVLVPIEKLADAAAFVRAANSQGHLRALLVHDPDACRLLPQLLYINALRGLSNLLVYRYHSIARRVLRAWASGSEHELIADAHMVGDHLFVVACSMEVFDVPCSTINALQLMSPNERDEFTIDADGAFIHWKRSDVDLDLEAFQLATDPLYREKVLMEHLQQCKDFGNAIATLRKKTGLRQSDIDGLTKGQVRGIEHSGHVHLAALRHLAVAHKMGLSNYLNRLAELAQPS